MPLSTVYRLFKTLKLDQVAPTKPTIVAFPGDTTVQQALELLREHGINGAPVLNREGLVRGFVDYLDIAAFVLSKGEAHLAEGFNSPVIEAVEKSGRDPLVQVSHSTSASMLVRVFSEGVHRSPVTDEEGAICNVLTQSDLLRVLVKEAHEKEDIAKSLNVSVESLQIASTPATIMSVETPMMDVIYALSSSTPSVPLVDSTGVLVGSVDGTCLHAFSVANVAELRRPAREYLRSFHPSALEPATAEGKNTLLHVVELLSRKGTHRAWLVDGEGRPFGVVSGTDVFRLIVKGLMAAARAD